ncbi:DKNYY domain-containing protein [Microscilla marina]|uniref:Uncharacterized protein n=1 Tax=Microscilla marina ATCC 23134 TaxID=313606 RepID=A1ZZI5_MICM2|nr:DKNYY domain-containing protein [Microscilla marina]EAY24180.1 hypothetical protein M23134_01768 [Microscilla marina ATCC 23134]
MFSKNNQVFYYNAGRHKSIALKEIDAQTFIKIGHFKANPGNQPIIHTAYPEAKNVEYFYCKDRRGVYLIEEVFTQERFSPRVTIYKLGWADPKTFTTNNALFPYAKDKNGVYLHIHKVPNLLPQGITSCQDIMNAPHHSYEKLPIEVLYQYP